MTFLKLASMAHESVTSGRDTIAVLQGEGIMRMASNYLHVTIYDALQIILQNRT